MLGDLIDKNYLDFPEQENAAEIFAITKIINEFILFSFYQNFLSLPFRSLYIGRTEQQFQYSILKQRFLVELYTDTISLGKVLTIDKVEISHMNHVENRTS